MEVEKAPSVPDEARKQVAQEALKEVADGDTITLESSDGNQFEVSKEAAVRLSTVLAEIIARGFSDGCVIKFEKIGSEVLEKVADYCNKHDNSIPRAALSSSSSSFNTAPSKEPKEWERKLLDPLNLVKAANSLGMDGLVGVTCRKVADTLEGKSLAQMREMFDIKNDFTEKEEEEEILQEHA